MKKYGKKWRKVQKEKEISRAGSKVGNPFSKARHKKHLCLHYGGVPSGILPGHCFSKLIQINDAECMCSKCRKTFSIEKYQQMESLVNYLSNKGCLTNEKLIAELSKGIEPVYYSRLSETEIEILESVTDRIIV